MYTKEIREMCIHQPQCKEKGPGVIPVEGTIVDLMMGNSITLKYNDLKRPLVDFIINGIVVKGALADTKKAMSVMTIQTMKRLGLFTLLQRTQIVL